MEGNIPDRQEQRPTGPGTTITMENDPRLIKGHKSYGNPQIFGDKSRIYAGKFCSISDYAVFDCGFNHGSGYVSQFPFCQKLPHLEHLCDRHPVTYGDTYIRNDVWVCDRAFIRSGITIGSGAIIGYGAIVTKNVSPYSVIAGNPAKEVRKRFSDSIIERLLAMAWWDWPDAQIATIADLLMSDRVEQVLDLHYF